MPTLFFKCDKRFFPHKVLPEGEKTVSAANYSRMLGEYAKCLSKYLQEADVLMVSELVCIQAAEESGEINELNELIHLLDSLLVSRVAKDLGLAIIVFTREELLQVTGTDVTIQMPNYEKAVLAWQFLTLPVMLEDCRFGIIALFDFQDPHGYYR